MVSLCHLYIAIFFLGLCGEGICCIFCLLGVIELFLDSFQFQLDSIQANYLINTSLRQLPLLFFIKLLPDFYVNKLGDYLVSVVNHMPVSFN